ncbi:MAG: hypothetical protein QOG53_1024 [Frankiales bacterium]|jgi:hypothetical protein|nr:hypothetical protein [Frankiales bacterium]
MSRRADDDMNEVLRDDALLDEFGGDGTDDAVSWEFRVADTDPVVALLGSLRSDVSDLSDAPDFLDLVGTPDAPTTRLPFVDLAQRRRRHLGRGTLVSGAVAIAVLSASGVAAAGIVSDRGAPLYPIHKLILGAEKTDSQKAADKVRKHLADAARGLDRGRLEDAQKALGDAAASLVVVQPADRGSLPAQLTALRARFAAALSAVGGEIDHGDNSGPGSGTGSGSDDNNSGPGSGDDKGGSGSDNSGPGSGSDDKSGSGSGDDSSGSGSGNSGSGSSDDSSGSGSSGSDDGTPQTSGSGTSDSGHGVSGGGDDAPELEAPDTGGHD